MVAKNIFRRDDHLESYACLVRCCGNAKDLSDARKIHALIEGTHYKNNVYIANLLVQMYGKCGSSGDARSVFDSILTANSFSWTILLQAHIHNQQLHEAKRVFDSMPGKNVVTWNALLSANAKIGQIHEARLVFDRIPEWDVVCMNAIVTGLARSGMIIQARNQFENVPERDSVSWNVIISAYAQAGDFLEAKKLFDRMERDHDSQKRLSNPVLWNSMIVALSAEILMEHKSSLRGWRREIACRGQHLSTLLRSMAALI
ncbi:pentatricopeptide repeat-containing protein At2g35030, mitochondrial-like [Selaginella moellendorffii]|uniref:pentatricopeptide repeat-containing protein At2g35030, mitochondrial-like n=1 Tax=Selaginella moellendorffii TaxID=88036 RepID=UPI000D1C635F|nr:pentatricopeptide repeat-containing protein At2g35030, mitochondrial-like [Selaginella moellendorffii]|eukprot:XP_024523813.1 pentatricopeptide repeat-containing protein At2g35030, mitochondrial-like [Selaginella moellendorffii]